MERVHTILAVDDDEDVLELAVTALTNAGFRVLQATSGRAALDIIKARADIDLLFTDIVMPSGMNGFELAHQAKQLRPDLQIVYASGYLKNIPFGENGAGYGPLIPKPWRPTLLATQIRSALAG